MQWQAYGLDDDRIAVRFLARAETRFFDTASNQSLMKQVWVTTVKGFWPYIYLTTAIALTPGGSDVVRTISIHRTTQTITEQIQITATQ